MGNGPLDASARLTLVEAVLEGRAGTPGRKTIVVDDPLEWDSLSFEGVRRKARAVVTLPE